MFAGAEVRTGIQGLKFLQPTIRRNNCRCILDVKGNESAIDCYCRLIGHAYRRSGPRQFPLSDIVPDESHEAIEMPIFHDISVVHQGVLDLECPS